MKYQLLLLIFVFSCLSSYAQETVDEADKVVLFIDTLRNTESLHFQSVEKIKNKTVRIAAENGITGVSYTTEFVIYPTFEIYDDYVLDGMDKMVVLKAEFGLYIQHKSSGKIFASHTQSISATAKTRKRALRKIITKIPTKGKKYKDFTALGKRKIATYYQSACSDIIAKADLQYTKGKHLEALSILSEVPSTATACFSKTKEHSKKIYIEYQDLQCKTLIQSAKGDIAQNNYSDAMKALSQIDPLSACYQQSSQLIQQIEDKVTAKEKQEWAFRQQKYKDEVALEKLRIEAITKIASAYYSRPPESTTLLYNLIID